MARRVNVTLDNATYVVSSTPLGGARVSDAIKQRVLDELKRTDRLALYALTRDAQGSSGASSSGRTSAISGRSTSIRTGNINALHVYRTGSTGGTGVQTSGGESTSEPPAEIPVEEKPKDWIGVYVVDTDGNPMPGIAYRITLPDGKITSGRTDATGKGKVVGIDSGNCTIELYEQMTDTCKEA